MGKFIDMAEIKGPNFEQHGKENPENVIDNAKILPETIVEKEANSETIRQKEEQALKSAKEIAGSDKNGDQGDVEVKPEEVEKRKEILVSRLVEAALATGDNVSEAMEVMERAKKYIGKYPGLVDEVHDRWLEQRNKGMY